jgi:hypothetical protein
MPLSWENTDHYNDLDPTLDAANKRKIRVSAWMDQLHKDNETYEELTNQEYPGFWDDHWVWELTPESRWILFEAVRKLKWYKAFQLSRKKFKEQPWLARVIHNTRTLWARVTDLLWRKSSPERYAARVTLESNR